MTRECSADKILLLLLRPARYTTPTRNTHLLDGPIGELVHPGLPRGLLAVVAADELEVLGERRRALRRLSEGEVLLVRAEVLDVLREGVVRGRRLIVLQVEGRGGRGGEDTYENGGAHDAGVLGKKEREGSRGTVNTHCLRLLTRNLIALHTQHNDHVIIQPHDVHVMRQAGCAGTVYKYGGPIILEQKKYGNGLEKTIKKRRLASP